MQDQHEALRKLQYGVHIVTSRKSQEELRSRNQDWVSASTISWAMQCSFDPPLIAIAVQKNTNLAETIQRSQNFAVHVLGEADRELAGRFDGPADFDDEQLNGLSFSLGKCGAPVLEQGIAVLECQLEDALTLPGDHMLFIGKLLHADLRQENGKALLLEYTPYEYGGDGQEE